MSEKRKGTFNHINKSFHLYGTNFTLISMSSLIVKQENYKEDNRNKIIGDNDLVFIQETRNVIVSTFCSFGLYYWVGFYFLD